MQNFSGRTFVKLFYGACRLLNNRRKNSILLMPDAKYQRHTLPGSIYLAYVILLLTNTVGIDIEIRYRLITNLWIGEVTSSSKRSVWKWSANITIYLELTRLLVSDIGWSTVIQTCDCHLINSNAIGIMNTVLQKEIWKKIFGRIFHVQFFLERLAMWMTFLYGQLS